VYCGKWTSKGEHVYVCKWILIYDIPSLGRTGGVSNDIPVYSQARSAQTLTLVPV